ncbi:MAG: glycosyltransferase family 4 protein, partial [Thermoplasmata archaeon]
RRGHSVTVLEWARHIPSAPVEERIEGIRVVRFRNTRLMDALPDDLYRNPLWWRNAVREGLRLFREEGYDAVHCHDLDTLSAGVRLRRKTGARLVYDAHEIFGYMIEEDYPRPVAAAAQTMERALLPSVDHLITVNDAMREFYGHLAGCPITVVMNCAEPVPTYVPPKAEGFTLTYIGVLHHSRFFPQAVEVLGDMPGLRFVIAGKREASYAEVERLATGYASIEFLGTIPASDVLPRTLEGHAVLCLFDPRHRINQIGSPNKMYEAMATGRPIIVSKGTYSGEFVEEHDFGLAIEYRGNALRQAVSELRDDPEGRRAMGQRGLDLAHQEFNWDAQAEKLLAVYENLA